MAPRSSTEQVTALRAEEMYLSADIEEMEKLEKSVGEKRKPLTIVWRNVAIFGAMHAAALLGAYQFVFVAKWATLLWSFAYYVFAALGITAGAHRLWAHRAYKATLPLRVFLMLANSAALQNDVIEWSRDHRCHHKWTDTEADPHNSRRGFFYSHVGWLLARKTTELKQMGTKIDLSDLSDDPILAFQRKHYWPMITLWCFLIPTFVPVYFWGESAFVAFYVAGVFRYVFSLNATWLINSAAHMFGYKPYDSNISPVESVWTNQFALGEGGHNFHHSFPMDYRASEFGYLTNWTRMFIDGCAKLGLAYDLKTASNEAIIRQATKKGDGSHGKYAHHAHH